MMKMTEFSAHFRLTNKIATLIKAHVSIKRELPIMKASRVYSGPEVRGTRPVLVTFETFKDRDEVLRKVSSVGFKEFVSIILLSQARLLKKANVHVEEDLSKRTRENRAELRKFMRQVSCGQGGNRKNTRLALTSNIKLFTNFLLWHSL